MRRVLRSFGRNIRATSAIEFAMIAPVYFLLTTGILEVGLISWSSALVAEGAERGAEYMRTEALAGRTMTDDGLRTAVCNSVKIAGLSCGADKLKIALFYAGVPVNGGFGVPKIIENVSDPRAGTNLPRGQYVLAVGYYWGIGLPTSKLLLPQGSGGSQIQARTYTVLKERVWDNP